MKEMCRTTSADWAVVLLTTLLTTPAPAAESDAAKAVRLERGVHLLIDEHFIERSEGVERRVNQPRRFLKEPVVTTGLEHQNWQPFLTVLHDAAAPPEGRFRMWYNVDVVDDSADGAFAGMTGYLESADAVHWPGPYRRMTSLPIDGRVRFGASVLDEGPQHARPDERYKLLYFDAGQLVGPRVAFSRDGLHWTLPDGGKPILKVNNGDDIWTAGYDPLRKRYYLIGKVFGPHTWTNAAGEKVTASIRRYFTSFSADFRSWSEPQIVFSPDEQDPGFTQWYGAAGFQVRGDLIVGFLRELRDDLSPTGVPQEAIDANSKGHAGLGASGFGARGGSGVGYTVLTWTRDGETWHRDRFGDKFFEPDPEVGTWDHAMSWVGSSTLVGDEVYLHYAGYRWGHKYRHSVDRQIGLVKMPRDRFVARQAGPDGGTIVTPLVALDGAALFLNANASDGEIRVQVKDEKGQPIEGFRFDDCQPIATDSLRCPVKWKQPLDDLRSRNVHLEFALTSAQLFALEVQ